MRVVIVGPNLFDQSRGSFHVHALGCGDLRRDRNVKDQDQSYVIDATSRADVSADVFQDIAADNGTDGSEYVSEFYFAPCCKF